MGHQRALHAASVASDLAHASKISRAYATCADVRQHSPLPPGPKRDRREPRPGARGLLGRDSRHLRTVSEGVCSRSR